MVVMLHLHSHHIQAIYSHAQATYPEECCGLLLGRLNREPLDSREVMEVKPLLNAWSPELTEISALITTSTPIGKTNRYWIDPKDMLTGQREARDRQMTILGIYHSHPDHPALPSECDRLMAWSGYSYLIVSVVQGIPQDLLSWRLDDQHQFQSEAIASDTIVTRPTPRV